MGLEVLDIRSGQRTLIHRTTKVVWSAKFSPDGEWIAYISNEQGLPQLYLLETFGGEQKIVRIGQKRWKRPMGKLHVRVIDERTGAPVPARIYANFPDGKFYAPSDAYARIGFPRMLYRSGDHLFYTQGEFTIEAPPGKIALEAVNACATPVIATRRLPAA